MPHGRPFPVATPLIVATALFMQNLDSTVVTTALPTIADSLGESPVRLNLIVTAYLTALAVFVPASGWIADRFGARRVFRLAIAVFTLGSIACGLASTLTELVAARVLQGMGGAMMVPVGRLVILRSVAKADLVRALAWLTVPALIGPAVGPPLGGLVVTYADWPWIFFLNLPIGIAGILLASRFIPDIREPMPGRFDLRGFALAALGLSAAVLTIEQLAAATLPAPALAALGSVGVVALLLYAMHAGRHPAPVLDLALFRRPTVAAGVLGGMFFRIGVGATPVLLPLMLQVGFGWSALASGTVTFTAALGAMTMKLTAGPILRRFGFRWVLLANGVLSAVLLAVNALLTPNTPTALIVFLLLLGGFLRSLQFTALNAIGYADVPSARLGAATSLSGTVQQVSQSLGVAVATLLLDLAMLTQGRTVPAVADFAFAWIGVALVTLLAIPFHTRLPAQAGAEVSGHVVTAAGRSSAGQKTEQPAADDPQRPEPQPRADLQP